MTDRPEFESREPRLSNDEQRERARAVSRKPMRVDPAAGIPRSRYARYIEFMTAEELLRFDALPPIRAQDIGSVDWADLERRLSVE